MASDREFLEQLRERQLEQIERMDGARRTYWRAPLIVAVVAWGLLLATTFLVAVGVVALWSGAHVFSSAVFLMVGIMSGALGAQTRGAQTRGAQTRVPSPQPSPRGRGGESSSSRGRGGR
ncbi:MAG: hypothetical protein K1X50_01910 [Candidatus Promineofilum sp.]|nr:hypothetical protein [Promineifilum sp.]